MPRFAANSRALSADREATARTSAPGARRKLSKCTAVMNPLPTNPTLIVRMNRP